MMADEIATTVKQQSIILELLNEIKELTKMNEEQQQKINSLETRASELKQYTRINKVVSGLVIKPKSYVLMIEMRNVIEMRSSSE